MFHERVCRSHSIHGTGGPVINPRRFREGPGPYSAGGSSGGSAAAVSSGLVPLALGTDTGGSIRLPASYCGIYGFKPTYGSISRHGLVSYASSLDTVGILGDSMGTVTDAFKVLSACKSAGDMTARTKMTAGRGSIDKSDCYKPMEQVTIGVPIELFTGNRLSPEAIENTEKIIEKFSMLGARIRRDISLPSLCTAAGTSTTATTAYYITAMTEAFSCLARYTANPNASIIPGGLPDGLRVELGRALGFGEQVYERISLGSILASSGAFARAQQVRQAIRAEFDAVFSSGIDVIVCPTAPSGPPLLSEVIGPADTDEGWMTDYLTVPASLAGLPAISLPVGRGGWARETVGVQLIAPAHHDQPLLHHSSQLQT